MIEREPIVTLPSGERVLAAVVDLVRHLEATGHTITVVDDGAIVSPAVHEDLAWLIDNSHESVRLVLACRA